MSSIRFTDGEIVTDFEKFVPVQIRLGDGERYVCLEACRAYHKAIVAKDVNAIKHAEPLLAEVAKTAKRFAETEQAFHAAVESLEVDPKDPTKARTRLIDTPNGRLNLHLLSPIAETRLSEFVHPVLEAEFVGNEFRHLLQVLSELHQYRLTMAKPRERDSDLMAAHAAIPEVKKREDALRTLKIPADALLGARAAFRQALPQLRSLWPL